MGFERYLIYFSFQFQNKLFFEPYIKSKLDLSVKIENKRESFSIYQLALMHENRLYDIVFILLMERQNRVCKKNIRKNNFLHVQILTRLNKFFCIPNKFT